jgi:DNA-binding NtrC family response regulator
MSSYPRSRSESWNTGALQTGPREVTVQRYRIEVIGGPNRGLVAAATGAELGVGTAPGNQLVLTDPTVSRHHCLVAATADGFLLSDLDSTSGTLLAGYRVQRAFVENGAVIQLGDSQLRFELTAETIAEPLSGEEQFDAVLGQSPAMRRLFALLERLAPTDATVLLEGETGTGKGHIAEAIHRRSARVGRPFVAVDCGAIPPHLLESELMGHEKGAFAEAHDRRLGALEAASGGTVFLDEIGELPLDLQPKLLRALESRQVRRVGSVTPIPLDIRVIAATSRDLRREVNRGGFRSDLFDRLAVMRLEVPPVRERREDIPLLVSHFFRQITGQPAGEPPADLVARMMRQGLPGNLRELRSAVERAVLLGDPRAASPAAERPGSADLDFTVTFREAKERAVARWTAIYVRALLSRFDGNLSRAARTVAMDRNHLRDLLRKYATEPGADGGEG